ncbi:MAG: CPBP family intramembrane metalloprotease [Mogibacterium sp.]|nr:CPBP family intramembrane metalloprotease [Mogibacterium sp.]
MKSNRKTMSHTQSVMLFIIMTVGLHVLGMKIYGMIAHTDLISDYITYGSKILGVILVTEMILFARLTPMKCNWSALKASKEELKRSLPVCIAISLLIIAALIVFRLYMNAKNPVYREIPYFGLYLNVHTRWLYPLSIVFQEFFIKAFVQDNIGITLCGYGQMDFPDALKKHTNVNTRQAIITAWITAVFFFILHMQYPLFYMTGALLLCLVTGVLYERNRNIWGAVLVHFAIGFMPRCLGVLQILEGYPLN